jgi:hypothetical protein
METILKIFSAGEIGRSSSFWKRSLIILIFIVALIVAIRAILGDSIDLTLGQIATTFVVLFGIPFIVNLGFFVIYRFPALGVHFSGRTNLVFAYNLEGVDAEVFLKKYKTLIAEVKNEINSRNFGSKIKIIITPSNINLKEKTAAEAMVMLGLVGSTLLIWGHATRHKKSKEIKFTTNFSYEFAYPRNQNAVQAKASAGSYLQELLSKGLISPVRMDTENFVEQIIPSIFFFLGWTTFTMNLLDKSEDYLIAFKKYFNEVDILRQQELGATLVECNNMLYKIYKMKMPHISSELRGLGLDKAEELSNKILEIRPEDYDANLSLAYICDLRKDYEGSHKYSEAAERHAPKGAHAHIFNNAYYAIGKKDYELALNIYDSIPLETDVITPDVSSYLNKKYSETKDPAYLFADGFVSYRWGDKEISKGSFSKFKKLSDKDAHKSLLNRLEEINDL